MRDAVTRAFSGRQDKRKRKPNEYDTSMAGYCCLLLSSSSYPQRRTSRLGVHVYVHSSAPRDTRSQSSTEERDRSRRGGLFMCSLNVSQTWKGNGNTASRFQRPRHLTLHSIMRLVLGIFTNPSKLRTRMMRRNATKVSRSRDLAPNSAASTRWGSAGR